MKKLLFSLTVALGFLFFAAFPAEAQTSVLATKIIAKQSVQLRMVGDSMLNNESWGLPRVFAQMIATKYTDATVVFKSRNYPGTGDGTTTDNTIQTGTGGYTVTIIRDSIPGTTSYRADNPNLIFGPGDKSVLIWLGVNDAVNFGLTPTYTPVILAANLRYMGLWARETYGTEVMLGEPAWSEYEPRVEVAGAAWVIRRTAKLNGFLVAPFRTTLENHFVGWGQAGQGDWFPNQNDNTHCGGDCHVALANTLFTAYGL